MTLDASLAKLYGITPGLLDTGIMVKETMDMNGAAAIEIIETNLDVNQGGIPITSNSVIIAND